MELMTNILLSILALLIAGSLGLAIALFLRVRRSVVSFITPTEEGQPSPLARSIDAASIVVARAVVAQAKTTFMGMESGQRRAETAVQADMALDAAAQSPLAGVLQAFPRLSKSLRRNPGMIDIALGLMSKMGPGSGNGHSAVGAGDRPRFNL